MSEWDQYSSRYIVGASGDVSDFQNRVKEDVGTILRRMQDQAQAQQIRDYIRDSDNDPKAYLGVLYGWAQQNRGSNKRAGQWFDYFERQIDRANQDPSFGDRFGRFIVPVALAFMSWANPALGAGVSGAATKAQGGSWQDALVAAGGAYLTGKGLQGAFGPPGGAATAGAAGAGGAAAPYGEAAAIGSVPAAAGAAGGGAAAAGGLSATQLGLINAGVNLAGGVLQNRAQRRAEETNREAIAQRIRQALKELSPEQLNQLTQSMLPNVMATLGPQFQTAQQAFQGRAARAGLLNTPYALSAEFGFRGQQANTAAQTAFGQAFQLAGQRAGAITGAPFAPSAPRTGISDALTNSVNQYLLLKALTQKQGGNAQSLYQPPSAQGAFEQQFGRAGTPFPYTPPQPSNPYEQFYRQFRTGY